MNIGFDAKRLFNNFTGLGNYSRFVVQALSEKFPDNNHYLFTPRWRPHPEVSAFLNRRNNTVISPPSWVTALKAGSLWRTGFLGRESSRKGITLFHGLSNELPYDISRVTSVVTIHDLIFLRFPEFYNRIDVSIYTAKVKHAVKAASRIVAISRQTAADIVELLGVDPSRIDVVYQGCHPNFKRSISGEEVAKVKRKYNLPGEFILNVGTIEPRKNALLILRALNELKSNSTAHLVIVGRPTSYISVLHNFSRQHNLQKRITYLQHVSFDELPAIYKLARVFVYPSLYEGFGIPLVEAISCGVPVITSTGSCFREAAGPSSKYADPYSPVDMATQLDNVLSDARQAAKMKSDSLEYIKQFEAGEIAASMMKVYLRALDNQR